MLVLPMPDDETPLLGVYQAIERVFLKNKMGMAGIARTNGEDDCMDCFN